MARIIRCCTDKGDIVIDPCAGSGTTGRVAVALKRQFIGWEMNPEYAASAVHSIRKGPARDVAGSLIVSTKAFLSGE